MTNGFWIQRNPASFQIQIKDLPISIQKREAMEKYYLRLFTFTYHQHTCFYVEANGSISIQKKHIFFTIIFYSFHICQMSTLASFLGTHITRVTFVHIFLIEKKDATCTCTSIKESVSTTFT